MTFHSYPRTKHIVGSNFQKGDHDMKAVKLKDVMGKTLIVEEKMDGAQAGISFENGKLMLQSRGHYLTGGPREKHFALLKQWSSTISDALYDTIGDQYVMYGENVFAKHTIFYDDLPHYFMEFDLYDKQRQVFLSTEARREVYDTSKISDLLVSVLVIAAGEFETESDFKELITRSNFITDDRDHNLISSAKLAGVSSDHAIKHTDMSEDMEGLYVKWEEDGIVKGRYKFVRESFTNSVIDQEQHWLDRPVIKNCLSERGRELMFL